MPRHSLLSLSLLVALTGAGLSAHANAASEYTLTRVRLLPKPGDPAALLGARIVGSQFGASSEGDVLATVTRAPADGEWLELKLPENSTIYRYLRFEGAPGSHARVAELEFYAGDRRMPDNGKPFGTYGDWRKDAPTFNKAFDGDPATYFESPVADNQYCGIQLPPEALAPEFEVWPDGAASDTPVTVKIGGEGERRYTLDGSLPDQRKGLLYDKPFTIDSNTVLTVTGFAPGKAPRGPESYVFRVGPGAKDEPQVRVYFVGNSLSDIVANGGLARVSGAAGKNISTRKTMAPGATTPALVNRGGAFGEKDVGAGVAKFAPIDHLVTQPYGDTGVKDQASASGKAYDLARQSSPGVTHWLYSQWPGLRMGESNARATGGFASLEGLIKTSDWAQGALNQLRYTEHVKAAMDAADPARPPTRIIPVSLALVNLKREIDAGRVPGVNDLFAFVFTDGLHMTPRGAYFVALVFHACLHGESPEGKLGPAGSGLDAEQAKILQRIAWETVKNYPHAGLGAVARK